jgi:hypothetical protein
LISDNAKVIFELLPDDGTALTGAQILDQIEIGPESFKKAKYELKEAGCVTLGRGRGGSVTRIPGATLPEAAPKLSKAQRMELAREEKAAKSKEQKRIDAARDLAQKEMAEMLGIDISRVKAFPKFPNLDTAIVEVWDEKKKNAKIYRWKES